jgi:hypothetical protein
MIRLLTTKDRKKQHVITLYDKAYQSPFVKLVNASLNYNNVGTALIEKFLNRVNFYYLLFVYLTTPSIFQNVRKD